VILPPPDYASGAEELKKRRSGMLANASADAQNHRRHSRRAGND